MMDIAQCAVILNRLASFLPVNAPNFADRAVLHRWSDEVAARLTREELTTAYGKLLETAKFWPSIAELVKAGKGEEVDRAQQVADLLEKAMFTFRRTNGPKTSESYKRTMEDLEDMVGPVGMHIVKNYGCWNFVHDALEKCDGNITFLKTQWRRSAAYLIEQNDRGVLGETPKSLLSDDPNLKIVNAVSSAVATLGDKTKF